VTSGGNSFNDIPDNQLTTFHVFIGWSRIFIFPLIYMKHRGSFPHHRMDTPPLTDTTDKETNERTDGRTDGRRDAYEETRLFVRPSVSRWSLTLIIVTIIVHTYCRVIYYSVRHSSKTGQRCRPHTYAVQICDANPNKWSDVNITVRAHGSRHIISIFDVLITRPAELLNWAGAAAVQ